MSDIKLRKYTKELEYSYAYGTYPVIDLLKYRSDSVLKIMLKKEGFGSDGVSEILDICEKKGIEYEINDREIDRLSFKENTYALGVFKKYDCDLDGSSNHLLLSQPRNMGNLGTIVRTMLGFGYTNLGIVREACDIFDPTVVRSSMGSLFGINFEYFDSIDEYVRAFPNRTNYLFMLDGAKRLEETSFTNPHTLVFGNEGSGLPKDSSKYGSSVYIQHGDRIDSLNLSIAVGIVLYSVSSR